MYYELWNILFLHMSLIYIRVSLGKLKFETFSFTWKKTLNYEYLFVFITLIFTLCYD